MNTYELIGRILCATEDEKMPLGLAKDIIDALRDYEKVKGATHAPAEIRSDVPAEIRSDVPPATANAQEPAPVQAPKKDWGFRPFATQPRAAGSCKNGCGVVTFNPDGICNACAMDAAESKNPKIASAASDASATGEE